MTQVQRRYFELCVIFETMQALKSGDLCLPGSEQFSDYRQELVSDEEYQQGIALYGEQAGIPVEGAAFVAHLRQQLETTANKADAGFPENEYLRLENDEPVLKRLQRKPDPPGRQELEHLLAQYMNETGILDAISDTEHWLNWTRFFGPLSGHDAKLDNPRHRYVLTTFCYGCDLGPTQTARSVKGLDRRQVSFVNQRHITEENLNQAITAVVNAYAQWPLQKVWGTGKSASADGTKWDMNAESLMAEHHIRYGGWGGIGYYLIADSYIALYSRFSTCGAWEGHYILDFLQENTSDVQPDTIHADTQGQSTAIFGLAYLLGIQLMPRIRHWKDLTLYRPSSPGSLHPHRYALSGAGGLGTDPNNVAGHAARRPLDPGRQDYALDDPASSGYLQPQEQTVLRLSRTGAGGAHDLPAPVCLQRRDAPCDPGGDQQVRGVQQVCGLGQLRRRGSALPGHAG